MEDKIIPGQVDLRTSPGEPEVRIEELGRRRAHFAILGFSGEWINLLEETRPTLFAPEVVDTHISGLIERGFSDPTKMITSSPAILGLAFENIDRRLKMFNKLISYYGLPLNAVDLMENNYFLFSSKVDKLWVLARTLKEFDLKPEEVNSKIIKGLVGSNLENVLVALKGKQEGEDIGAFMRRVRAIKKRKIPREEKRRIVKDEFDGFEKIKHRYFRGYPQVN